MRGYTRPIKCWFSCVFFCSVTKTNDRWVTFSQGWRKPLGLRLIWGLLQAIRPVIEKMAGYTRPKIAYFHVFLLRIQDQWTLSHIFWKVTQAAWIALNLRLFASKSIGKRRKMRVHQAQNCLFSCFFSAPWPRPMISGSVFLKGDASHPDCA